MARVYWALGLAYSPPTLFLLWLILLFVIFSPLKETGARAL